MAAILNGPPIFGENSWPKNYHELSYAWSNGKIIMDYHEEFEQAQNEW